MAENNFFPFNGDVFVRAHEFSNRNCHCDRCRQNSPYCDTNYCSCSDCRLRNSSPRRNYENGSHEWPGQRTIHIHNNNANTNPSSANANVCVRLDRSLAHCNQDSWRGDRNGNANHHGRDHEGNGPRRDSVNFNLTIGCVCAQGNESAGRNHGGGGSRCGGSGWGCESMLQSYSQPRNSAYCGCCGQSMRYFGGRSVVCCEVGWRPRFEIRDRRRCGLARCLLAR